jgi:Family of unknown function (DUF5397)
MGDRMQSQGFQEEQSSYAIDDPNRLIGQIRRIGEAGPAYEVMNIDDSGNAVIEVIESGERVKFTIAEVMEDPMAETIP